MVDIRNHLLEALKDVLIPPACPVCRKPSSAPVCTQCMQAIEVVGGKLCPRCGTSGQGETCTNCRSSELYYYQARHFAYYAKTIKVLVLRYKKQGMHTLAGLLARFLEICYNSHYSAAPIHYLDGLPSEPMARICRCLESNLKIPYANNFKKIGPAAKQKFLSAQDRRLNPQGAYKVARSLKFAGKNLLLVDDIFTTGSTLNCLARLAKRAGADKVYLLTLARGV